MPVVWSDAVGEVDTQPALAHTHVVTLTVPSFTPTNVPVLVYTGWPQRQSPSFIPTISIWWTPNSGPLGGVRTQVASNFSTGNLIYSRRFYSFGLSNETLGDLNVEGGGLLELNVVYIDTLTNDAFGRNSDNLYNLKDHIVLVAALLDVDVQVLSHIPALAALTPSTDASSNFLDFTQIAFGGINTATQEMVALWAEEVNVNLITPGALGDAAQQRATGNFDLPLGSTSMVASPGSTTFWTTELGVGQDIVLQWPTGGGSQLWKRRITAIVDDSHLTIDSPISQTILGPQVLFQNTYLGLPTGGVTPFSNVAMPADPIIAYVNINHIAAGATQQNVTWTLSTVRDGGVMTSRGTQTIGPNLSSSNFGVPLALGDTSFTFTVAPSGAGPTFTTDTVIINLRILAGFAHIIDADTGVHTVTGANQFSAAILDLSWATSSVDQGVMQYSFSTVTGTSAAGTVVQRNTAGSTVGQQLVITTGGVAPGNTVSVVTTNFPGNGQFYSSRVTATGTVTCRERLRIYVGGSFSSGITAGGVIVSAQPALVGSLDLASGWNTIAAVDNDTAAVVAGEYTGGSFGAGDYLVGSYGPPTPPPLLTNRGLGIFSLYVPTHQDENQTCFVTGQGGTNVGNISGLIGFGFTAVTTPVGIGIPVTQTVVKALHALNSNNNAFAIWLDTEGLVWVCGTNRYLQVGGAAGVVVSAGSVTTPTIIPTLSGIVDIAINKSNCYALDSSGNVWGWGINTAGELTTQANLSEIGTALGARPLPFIIATGARQIAMISGFGVYQSLGGAWFYAGGAALNNQIIPFHQIPGSATLQVIKGGAEFTGISNAGAAYTLVIAAGSPRPITGILAIPAMVGIPVVDVANTFSGISAGTPSTGQIAKWFQTVDGRMLLLGAFSTTAGMSGDGLTHGPGSSGAAHMTTFATPNQVTLPLGVTVTKIFEGGSFPSTQSYTPALIGSDGQVYTWGNDLSGQRGRDTPIRLSNTGVPIQTTDQDITGALITAVPHPTPEPMLGLSGVIPTFINSGLITFVCTGPQRILPPLGGGNNWVGIFGD